MKAQSLLTNVYGRNTTSLNGEWQIIIDPYETGFYDYRFKEKNEKDPGAYWNIIENSDNRILVEHGYSDKDILKVPGDWNSQDPKLLYYEGTVWYRKKI